MGEGGHIVKRGLKYKGSMGEGGHIVKEVSNTRVPWVKVVIL